MNIPPEWATHIMADPDSRESYWWSEKCYQQTHGRGDRHYNYFPKERWERAGWVFEEINIQLEND